MATQPAKSDDVIRDQYVGVILVSLNTFESAAAKQNTCSGAKTKTGIDKAIRYVHVRNSLCICNCPVASLVFRQKTKTENAALDKQSDSIGITNVACMVSCRVDQHMVEFSFYA